MSAAQGLQFGSVWVLNLALALLLGLVFARRWLTAERGAWADAARRRLDRAWRPAATACLAGAAAALWSAAATMAGVDPIDAGPALWTMLTSTAFGKMGVAGLLCAATLLLLPRARTGAAVPIVLFAAARAANSHAAEEGMLSIGLLIEWLHLLLVCFWLGSVAVAAWGVMPAARSAPASFMRRLSHAATMALLGILATGVFNAWRGIGSLAQAVGNPYANVLLVKVVLVGLAAAMGGYNKLAAFPRAQAGDPQALIRARRVLQLESFVLAGAMLAAAVLVAQQPPTMV